jgi:hypothetical protein
MSGKSRRRGRRLSRSQRRRLGRVGATPLAPSVATPLAQAGAQKPAPVPRAATVSPRASAQRMAIPLEPPNISGELKRIGVIGGIIGVLLVAAYFVLPLILD